MKSNAAIIIASLGASAYLSCAPTARAMDPGFYVGGYYGSLERDRNKDEDLAFMAAVSQGVWGDYAFQPVTFDPHLKVHDESWGFLAGYRWSPNFGLELGYLQLGELKYNSDDQLLDLLETPAVPVSGHSRFKTDLSAITISALGIWPLSYEWELFGRAGLALTSSEGRVRIEALGGSATRHNSKQSADLLAGVGISYTFLDVYTLRGEIQRVFDAGNDDIAPETDVDLLSLSFVVSF